MYTIRQAAARSGVSIPLLRAWERRYAVVQPERTPAGYRLYDEPAIERLRAMRLLVDGGWSPREAAVRVSAADPVELAAIERELAPPPDADGPFAELAAAFMAGALAMDGAAVDRALERAFAAGRFEAVADGMLVPALRQLGQAWATGDLSVAAEHAASAAVMRRLGLAYEAAGDRPDGAAILIGLPAGSRHEAAAFMVAVAARRAGLDPTYLGADVPAESWLEAVRIREPRAVVLGVVTAADIDPASATLRLLGRQAPRLVRAAGGRHADSIRVPGVVTLPDGIERAVATLAATLASDAGTG